MEWMNAANLTSKHYICGHCRAYVASSTGHITRNNDAETRICPGCSLPTLFYRGDQMPSCPPGGAVEHLPKAISRLYDEARWCVGARAYTAAVLACRKLLMNIAVEQGAEAGVPFVAYVDFLADKGFIPPNGRAWVDHIRKRGNEANHEIQLMSREDAVELITFSEMLLKFIFEFPMRVPASTSEPKVPK